MNIEHRRKMSKTQLYMILNLVLFFQITNISTQDSQPLGRLLTPEEGCGITKIAKIKIVGGTEAKPGAFPWIALIAEYKADGNPHLTCGGSLITSRHVLTAAHCVRTNGTYLVRLGEHDLTTMSDGIHQDVRVIRVDAHSDHNPVDESDDRHNDIAVLTLERDVEFDDRIRPICLPLTKEVQSDFNVGTNPFVAGWGKLQELGNRSKVLRQVQVPVIDNVQCENLYKQLPNFSETEFNDMVLCAGNLAGGEGACYGDSGGPLMLPILKKGTFPMYQIGIVSYAYGCGRPRIPGVFTRVSKFIDWIQDKVDRN